MSCGRPVVDIDPMPRKVAEAIEGDPRGSLTIGVEFLQIVERFERIWGKSVSSPIWFSDKIPVNILALCHTFIRNDGIELTEIVVQPDGFNPDSVEGEIILFHELGHCELKRDHDKSLAKPSDNRFIAYSIMYPTIISAEDYSLFYEHYMLELFSRGQILKRVKEPR
jgi:hypothetical protein